MVTESSSGQENILELHNVSKVFKYDILKPRQTVIKNLHCSFPAGSCTGLLGHNGAGKTTTIRLILGLLKPDSGSIHFQNRNINTAAKSQIGYMPEVNKLPGGLTAEEVLQHHLLLYKPDQFKTRAARNAAVAQKLQDMNLTAHKNKKVSKLSKGMARRVAWAQATIHTPKLLILDEPSSGLDPLGRAEMINWITEEKKRGTTIILCTHELAQVSLLCEQFHVLRRGELVMTSMPEIAAKAGAGCRLYDWSQKYAVHVSGLDEALVRKISTEKKLPLPTRFKQSAMNAVLGFDSYEASSDWVQSLLGSGCMILKFSEEMVLTDDDLQIYFRNEG